MTTQLNPYLSFTDNARQAMVFYQTIFGGKLESHTFGEYHASQDPDEQQKIMHSMLTSDDGIVFMASDTPKGMEHKIGNNISMSLSGDDAVRLTSYFDKLAQGGTVVMPLEKAPWGDTFGMLTDKFGVNWLVNIAGERQ